ncbi:winged helix-turn-helix domain-containing protein [Agrobacterium larrymoorei]|nr:winged helix-turn-helix domain-containing protein [Agrobacterium larrymoorei]
MGFDRIHSDRFFASHESLAWMLAVRRASATEALHLLEGERVIFSQRNVVILRDLEGLRSAAGPAYGLAEREYARLLGCDFRSGKTRQPTETPPELFVDDVPQDVG